MAINSCSFKYDLPSKVIEHFAFYNFFQRPAEETGKSIKIQKVDREVASRVFLSILKRINPELVIFTSSLAGKVGSKLLSGYNIPFAVTPHPTCAWWNRTAKKYNGKGKDIAPDFLTKYEWVV